MENFMAAQVILFVEIQSAIRLQKTSAKKDIKSIIGYMKFIEDGLKEYNSAGAEPAGKETDAEMDESSD